MTTLMAGTLNCFAPDYCFERDRYRPNPYPNYNIGEYAGHRHLYIERVCATCGDSRLSSPPRYVPGLPENLVFMMTYDGKK